MFNMNFSDIIGQRQVIDGLKSSIKNNRVGHAYIFEGPAGIGKQTIASVFASALVCSADQSSSKKAGEPCGSCRDCIKSRSGNHPDIQELRVASSNRSSAGIGVDMIRELQRDIYVKPYEANKKIYIIPRAERMTIQAQNSLLKVLEEPPVYGMIILTVENAARLLETILSRAVLIRFRIHPQKEVEAFLSKHYPDLKDEIPVLAAFSGGIIGKAEGMATSEEFRAMRWDAVGIMMKLLSENELDILQTVNYFAENKHLVNEILDFLLSLFRDIIFIKELHNENRIINRDMRPQLKEFSQRVFSGAIASIMNCLLDTKKKISMNVNYTLAIETMLMKSWEDIHGRSSRRAI